MPIFDARVWAAARVSKTDQKIALTQYERAIQVSFREVADALAVQRLNCLARRLLQRIGDADEAPRTAVHGGQHHRVAVTPQLLRPGIEAHR